MFIPSSKKNYIRRLIVAIFLGVSLTISAQSYPIRIDISVMPPFTSAIADYIYSPNKIVATITNLGIGHSDVDIFLRGSIASDGGIEVKTSNSYKPANSIHIPAGMVYTLTAQNVTDMFDVNLLDVKGINRHDLINGAGLPEDNYQICIRAYDFYTNKPISDEEPLGCSNYFMVTNLEPPMITWPICGDTVSGQENLFITWNSFLGTSSIQYKVEIVEISEFSTISRFDAFNSSGYPPFYSETVPVNLLMLTKDKVLLTPGYRYAFRVQAFDPMNKGNFRNNGYSEVCSFVYSESTFGKFNQGQQISIAEDIKKMHSQIIMPSTITGKINYKYADGHPGGSNGYPLSGLQVSLKVIYLLKNAQFNGIDIGSGVLREQCMPITSDGCFNSANAYFYDNFKTLDTKITGTDGSFSFTAIDTLPTGLIQEDFTSHKTKYLVDNIEEVEINEINSKEDIINPIDYVTSPVNEFSQENQFSTTSQIQTGSLITAGFVVPTNALGGPQGSEMTAYSHTVNTESSSENGDLYRVYRVVVESPYFCSPPIDFVVEPGDHLDVGTLNSLVKTYDLNLTVKSDSTILHQALGRNAPIHPANLFVAQKNNLPQWHPQHDGQDLEEQKDMGVYTLPLCSKEPSSSEGSCLFYNLVKHDRDNLNDEYVLYAETPKREGSYIYKSNATLYPKYPQWGTIDAGQFPVLSDNNAVGTMNYYVFNNDYVSNTYQYTMYVKPNAPRIAGRIMYKTAPLAGVKCSVNINGSEPVYTDLDGYFSFDNVVTGKNIILTLEKYGYQEKDIEAGILELGNQFWNNNIELIPWGQISGYVKDEEGNTVEAFVQIDDLGLFPTKNILDVVVHREKFLFRAPSGSRKLTVIPVSDAYMTYDTTLEINKNTDDDVVQHLGTFILKKKQHKIGISIRKYSPFLNSQHVSDPTLPVPQAKVKILGHEQLTNSDGIAIFEFKSPLSSFDVSIMPPDNSDFAAGKFKVYNNPSNEVVEYTFILQDGFSISGTVTAGNENKPVPFAHIFADIEGDLVLETYSDLNGLYTLKGIPEIENQGVPVRATKNSNQVTYIGDKKTAWKDIDVVDFHLTIYDKMDVSKLYGIPVQIEELTEKASGTIISGSFVDLPGYENISAIEPRYKLPFKNLRIIEGEKRNSNNIPIAVALYGAVTTERQKIPVKVFNKYDATLQPYISAENTYGINLIRVTKDNNDNGYIRGKVNLDRSSFSLNKGQFDFYSSVDLFLAKINSSEPYLDAFKVQSTQEINQFYMAKLKLINKSGGNTKCKLLGFNADINSETSYITPDFLNLDVSIKPIHSLSTFPTSLNATGVKVNTNKVFDFAVSQPFSFDLEEWTVNCPNGFKASGSGGVITANNVIINTTMVRVEADELKIFPNRLDFEGYHFGNMTLANVVPLNIEANTEVWFYLDNNITEDAKQHYVLKLIGDESASQAASFGGLPGLSAGEKIIIPGLIVTSNGKVQIFGFEELDNDYWFYNSLKLKLQMITTTPDALILTGIYDLNIPNLSNKKVANLKFIKSNNGLPKIDGLALNVNFDGIGNVNFEADRNYDPSSQTINNTEYNAIGKLTITDNGATKQIDAKLHRLANNGAVYVEVLKQDMFLGTNNLDPYLDITKGEMRVTGSSWDYLWIEGAIKGAEGLSQSGNSKTKFTVKGAIDADPTSVSVTNLGGMNGLKLTYDIKNSEFFGTITIPETGFGPAKFDGTLQTRFGNQGWYFMGCGKGSLPVLGGFEKMAVLFGDYDNTAIFMDELEKYTIRKDIPVKQSFNGIFISGAKSDIFGLTLPDIDWSFKIPVIEKKVGVSLDWDILIGADCYKSFSDSKIVFGARGYVKADLVASLALAYAKGSLFIDALGEGVIGLYPPSVAIDICNGVSVKGEVGGCLPLVGCGSVSFDKSMHFRIEAAADSYNGLNKVDFSVGEGGCD